MKYVFFEMALFWCCLTVPALALDPIDLGERNTLTITTDAIAKTTTVTLTNDGYLTESVILGNAGVDDAAAPSFALD